MLRDGAGLHRLIDHGSSRFWTLDAIGRPIALPLTRGIYIEEALRAALADWFAELRLEVPVLRSWLARGAPRSSEKGQLIPGDTEGER